MKLSSLIQKNQKKLLRAGPKIVLAGLFCFFVVLSNLSWAPANNTPAKAEKPAARATLIKPATPNFIQREGTRIVDRRGYFRMAGDRVIFFLTEREKRYMALENLNLERIAQAMADQPRQRRWKVTGILTEYQGENYLLIEKALLESWGSTTRQPR